MHVDSSVELGRDDPALEFPWAADDGSIQYQDLKHNPALIAKIHEADNYCELRDFLLRINAHEFPLQTAKADIWITDEILPEEEFFAAPQKLVSYMDLIFVAHEARFSLQSHVEFVNKLCALLQHAPDMPATIEFVIRRCYYHEVALDASDDAESNARVPARGNTGVPANHQTSSTAQHGSEGCAPAAPLMSLEPGMDLHCGFCITVYASGFGHTEQDTRQRWSIALKLLQHALVQAATV